MKAIICRTGGRAPPVQNTRTPSSGFRWPGGVLCSRAPTQGVRRPDEARLGKVPRPQSQTAERWSCLLTLSHHSTRTASCHPSSQSSRTAQCPLSIVDTIRHSNKPSQRVHRTLTPVGGFRLALRHRTAQNRTTATHQIRQRLANLKTFARCPPLAWFYEETFRWGQISNFAAEPSACLVDFAPVHRSLIVS